MKNYQTTALIGTQWGDEGKGKISDYLAAKADIVVRFQGGNNAGHLVSFNGQKYALNHLPSGIFNPQTTNVLAQGMVINPGALVKEIAALKKQNITDFKLLISDRAHLIMPYHIDLDRAAEKTKNKTAFAREIGTTKKGIGPAYADKASRIGIRVCDFIKLEALKLALAANLVIKNKQLQAFGLRPYTASELFEQLQPLVKILRPLVTDTGVFLDAAIKAGKKVLFEGAQGTMLCIDNGTYPFVTSSSPTAAAIPLGTGLRPSYVSKVIGVVKAYSTRVGAGQMVTELSGSDAVVANVIRRVGNEFGTVTGRPRRIGWLDIVALNYAIRLSGITELAITLVDVLKGVRTLKIATAYNLDNKKINYLPSASFDYKRCQPEYIQLEGWEEDISSIKSYQKLPQNVKIYINTIEKLTDVKVSLISVGPDRNQIIRVE